MIILLIIMELIRPCPRLSWWYPLLRSCQRTPELKLWWKFPRQRGNLWWEKDLFYDGWVREDLWLFIKVIWLRKIKWERMTSVPRPVFPKKPVAWHSSMKIEAPYLDTYLQNENWCSTLGDIFLLSYQEYSYTTLGSGVKRCADFSLSKILNSRKSSHHLSASSFICGRGHTLPSIEKTPSVTINLELTRSMYNHPAQQCQTDLRGLWLRLIVLDRGSVTEPRMT